MKIVLTPDWFLGKDVLIDFFSFVVLLIFFFLTFKNYKIDKNKKLLYLGVGFGMIAFAQLSSILTKLVLYYDNSFTQKIGEMIVTSHIISSVDIFYDIGFFFYRALTLLGLYVIYKLPMEEAQWEDFFLASFFVIIISILSKDMTYLFALTSFILLILIIKNYFLVYIRNRSINTLILFSAFSILALSNLIFLFSWSESMYVFGNFDELVSYIILLVLIIRILKHGSKKKQNGYHLRHIGNNSG